MRGGERRYVSLSGVPLFFDRFGMIDGLGAGLQDPLAAARGIVRGLAIAVVLWIAIGFAIGLL